MSKRQRYNLVVTVSVEAPSAQAAASSLCALVEGEEYLGAANNVRIIHVTDIRLAP